STRKVLSRFSQRTVTYNSNRRTAYIVDRMIQQAELLSMLPRSTNNVFTIGNQISTQREDQSQHMFRQRRRGVVTSVAHCDIVRPTELQIDVIDTGCGHGNQSQRWQVCQYLCAQRQFVTDCNRCVPQTLDNLMGRGELIVCP